MNILTLVNAAYINNLEVHYRAGEPEHVRVIVGYDQNGYLGTISFEVPVRTAQQLYIGQRLDIDISVAGS